MKRLTVSLFTLLLALLVSTPALFAQDATLEEVLQHHFEVKNQQKLSQINTVTASGKVLIQGGALELPFTMKQKRDNMVRVNTNMQGQEAVLMAYDGTNGWMLAPWTGSTEPQDLPADQLKSAKESADIDSPLYHWKEKGHKLELIGMDEVEGTPAYKLKLTKKSGNVDYYYLDADAYVPLKVTSKQMIQGTEVESTQFLSNYQEVNGIVMPFNIDNRVNGQSAMQIIISEYSFGDEIPDSYFQKPSDTQTTKQ